ncbi:hypothetical protein ACEG18_01360 [Collinsella aerofaciens]|uniref:hypothetical protein n=1 Tax=Collinsella aerofaciens TaxID=74426 RepID=UPI00355B9B1F
MITDGVVICFNGQIDFGTAVAFLSLALTLLQWIVSLVRGRRAAARSQASAICARVVRMSERETATVGGCRADIAPQFGLEVMNNSNDLVYQVILTAVLVQGAGPEDGRAVEGSDGRVLLSSVAPGKTVRCIGHLDCSMHKALGCEVAFTDRYGRSWVRKSDGHLGRIRFKTPVDYYGLMQPVEWMDFDEP